MPYRTQIASDAAAGLLMAEIYLDEEQLASVFDDGTGMKVEIYPKPGGGAWLLDEREFLRTVEAAEGKLRGEK